MSNGPEKPNNHRNLRVAGAVLVGGAGLGTVGVITGKVVLDEMAKSRVAAEQVIPMPTNTAELKGETVTLVPNTPEATSTPTPAEKPATPTTAPATATATVVEKKPLMPVYGAFAGNLSGDTGGMIVVANIPQKGIFVYYWETVNGMGTFRSYTAEAENVQPDGTFQVSNQPGGLQRIIAHLDPTGTTLIGVTQYGLPGKKPTREASFQAKLNGTGKAAVRQDLITITTQRENNGQIKAAQIDEMMSSWPAN